MHGRWLDDDPYPRAEVEHLTDQHDGIRVAELHGRLLPRIRRVHELRERLEGAEEVLTFRLLDGT